MWNYVSCNIMLIHYYLTEQNKLDNINSVKIQGNLENIIRFIGVSINSKHLCIITELCENGDLYDYMRKSTKPTFTQQVKKKLLLLLLLLFII